MTWGWITERPAPPEIMDARFRPVPSSAGVRRDLRTYVLSTPPKAELLPQAELVEIPDSCTLIPERPRHQALNPPYHRRQTTL